VTKRPTMFKNIIYDVKLVKLYNSMLDKCHYTIGNLPKEKSFLVEKKRDNCEGSFILVCMHCSAKSVYFTTSKSRWMHVWIRSILVYCNFFILLTYMRKNIVENFWICCPSIRNASEQIKGVRDWKLVAKSLHKIPASVCPAKIKF
jgi:hypothetical protein